MAKIERWSMKKEDFDHTSIWSGIPQAKIKQVFNKPMIVESIDVKIGDIRRTAHLMKVLDSNTIHCNFLNIDNSVIGFDFNYAEFEKKMLEIFELNERKKNAK